MDNPRIVTIEWGRLEGTRPRSAGANSRIGPHGNVVRPAIARITTEDGSSGFGATRASREQSQALIGGRLADAFQRERGVAEAWIGLEYALLDLVGNREGMPVYALAAQTAGRDPGDLSKPFTVPCYDTSLYFDDLHLKSDEAAAALIAGEARQGFERGHRAFKIKVGRGAKHMPLEEGTRRDVAVIRAVREATGTACPIMIDANNGYNLNLAKRVLEETEACRLFWLEEAFQEDPVLYRDLKEWMEPRGITTLIADGEGWAPPALLDWARDRVVDVVQYDYLGYGFTRWLAAGRQLDEWGVRSAPHHYGGWYGNYASGHLAGAIRNFTFVEWDEATIAGFDTSGYRLHDGRITLPDAPGFGLELEEAVYARAVKENGFTLTA